MNEEGTNDLPSYGLPSKILCKVVCVQLKAEVDTDEVYAEITLIPYCEESVRPTSRRFPEKIPASFFRKRLTPSDVSKQGGCSLHKKHVDQTLPPLDISQDSASQDLVAKDLQGQIWNFHHICRGTPSRHLLTSGWGKFVTAKRLMVGDTCIFLRGQNELYIGVQRAVRLQKLSTDLSSINMKHGILATALESITTRSEFTVYYHPRISPSGFIVAYHEFMESLKVNYSPETRVEMIFDERGEDSEHNLKKFLGTITGKEDVDPKRWPLSEWRCLKVCWDATSSEHVLPERVSPWSIQSLESALPHQQSVVSFGQKRSMPLKPMIGQGLTFPKVNNPSSSSEDESRKCKLFGVDLGNKKTSANSYIKVLKDGSFVGRSVDVSRFSGYRGLVSELDKMFEFEGSLVSGTSGWLVTYADGDGDKKLLGDLSWTQFRGVVRKMCICPKEKVGRWK